MARVSVNIYKKSFFATLLSIIATILLIVGLALLFEETTGGIICIVISIIFMILAPIVADRKQFKLGVKAIKNQGGLEQLATSRDLCWELYRIKPGKSSARFIAQYNPTVGTEMMEFINNKKKKNKNKKTEG